MIFNIKKADALFRDSELIFYNPRYSETVQESKYGFDFEALFTSFHQTGKNEGQTVCFK